jgi:hypothetical protein
MKSRLAQVGALALAGGMLSLIVGHAALSGCHGPAETVATPSADSISTNQVATPDKSKTPDLASTAGGAPASPPALVSAPMVVKPAPPAPVFMGASKAAPVFRGDQLHAATPSTPSQAQSPNGSL